jgi:DNA-binding NarL/FixJ family response regulator
VEESIRVLIVDDIRQVREGLKTVLTLATKNTRRKIIVIGEAQNGNEAIQQAAVLQPDVVLMDLEMPILDGYEATRQIKAGQPATRVIILSIHAETEAQQLAQSIGADGFVTKDSSLENLLNAILKNESNNSN